MTCHIQLRLVLAALLALTFAGAANAQSERKPPRVDGGPIETIRNFKLRHDPVEPADFVKKSRPPEEKLQFLEVGSSRPEPAGRALTYEQIRAKEAELDGVRARHHRIGRRVAPKVKIKSAAMEPKPRPVKKKQVCLISCTVDPLPRRE